MIVYRWMYLVEISGFHRQDRCLELLLGMQGGLNWVSFLSDSIFSDRCCFHCSIVSVSGCFEAKYDSHDFFRLKYIVLMFAKSTLVDPKSIARISKTSFTVLFSDLVPLEEASILCRITCAWSATQSCMAKAQNRVRIGIFPLLRRFVRQFVHSGCEFLVYWCTKMKWPITFWGAQWKKKTK